MDSMLIKEKKIIFNRIKIEIKLLSKSFRICIINSMENHKRESNFVKDSILSAQFNVIYRLHVYIKCDKRLSN